MEIKYIGEQLFWGYIGNGFIFTAFISALYAAILYLTSVRNEEKAKWATPLARKFLYLHSIACFGIFFLLLYLIFNHRFEYYYVWQHSNMTMPMYYILACIWEGQEGSFLLWMLWHSLIALFVSRRNRHWESPVVGIIMLVQVFLGSMLLGVYVFGYKLGSNPFTLLRDNEQFANLPFIKMPDYLSRIADGRGLNPLLQNYWMVIHPPTLFLGFASTVVPFAFALGGLMRKNITEWIKPALPYAFFSIMSLGAGILMGAAWAYEALSFGGFWAWDPVENASLVPWLVMVGAGHVMLVFNKRGRALLSTYILCILSFLLVLYSTFLTRSGILGETSVHAFTDLGMSGQLIFYMLFFVILAVVMLAINWKKIPKENSDDSITSREFWMFIGMLVLCISAIQITFTTSIPVINKIFGSNLAPPVDVKEHFNYWQMPIAMIIALLMAVGQFFKYKESKPKEVFKKLLFSLIISTILSVVLILLLKFNSIHYMVLLFTAVFAIIANFDYFLRVLKGKFSFSGASIAHIGFAFILLGTLISNANSRIISKNRLNIDLGKDFPNNENIMLAKGDTLQMGKYFVTYSGREKKDHNIYFDVEYFKLNNKTGELKKAFSLKPIIQLNERMGNSPEPATKWFPDKDIYTHVTYANLDEYTKNVSMDEYDAPVEHEMAVGDTLATSNSLIVLQKLAKDNTGIEVESFDSFGVTAMLEVTDVNKKKHLVTPQFLIKDRMAVSKNYFLDELGLKFRFTSISPESGKIKLEIAEKKANKKDFIIMKAIIFPHINLLWIGCILMLTGTWIVSVKRFKEYVRYTNKG